MVTPIFTDYIISGSLMRDTPPVAADIGRNPLKRHDRDRVLGDLDLARNVLFLGVFPRWSIP
jgi:hypothetical protein